MIGVGKTAIVGTVAMLSFSLTSSPLSAQAAEPVVMMQDSGDYWSTSAKSMVQGLDIPAAPAAVSLKIDSLDLALDGSTAAELNSGGHHFDVAATIAAARVEIGMSMPTGWDMPGECIAGAKRWIVAGGGAWTGSGTPVANYDGATRVDWADVSAGDIIQYTNIQAPTAWATGVHTLLITGTNGDGSFQIVEQNNPGGSGLVSANDNWRPTPPDGFEAVAWRF